MSYFWTFLNINVSLRSDIWAVCCHYLLFLNKCRAADSKPLWPEREALKVSIWINHIFNCECPTTKSSLSYAKLQKRQTSYHYMKKRLIYILVLAPSSTITKVWLLHFFTHGLLVWERHSHIENPSEWSACRTVKETSRERRKENRRLLQYSRIG